MDLLGPQNCRFIPTQDILEPPDFVDRYITKDDRLVSRIPWDDEITSAEIFIDHGIQISLADSKMGLCNWIHEIVTYKYNYNHPRAIELGRLAARLRSRLVQLGSHPEKTKVENPIYDSFQAPGVLVSGNEPNSEYKCHVMDIVVLHTLPTFR